MPKAFISYSWTNQDHQDRVKELADRLISDGVEVIIDIYDLREGADKYHFMECMVTDPSVTHVLVICDVEYARKANARSHGVGTECQIISKEVYDKVIQSKFVALVFERVDGAVDPVLPTFLKGRIFIDFSSEDAANRNYDQLLRWLHNRPRHQKPRLGNVPSYLTEESNVPAIPLRGKFLTLRQAMLDGKRSVPVIRTDFLNACVEYADGLRIREVPITEGWGKRVVEDCGKLVPLRDVIIDWLQLEEWGGGQSPVVREFIEFLERLLEMKGPSRDLKTYSDEWFEAHKLFLFETFLYVVTVLLRRREFVTLNRILMASYSIPTGFQRGDKEYGCFDEMYASSDILQSVLAKPETRLLAPAAELVRRQATRKDLSMHDIIQADLVLFLVACVIPDGRWFPQTLYYSDSHRPFPLFAKASRSMYFNDIVVITGIGDAEDLKAIVRSGIKRMGLDRLGHAVRYWNSSIESRLNLEKWNSTD